MRVKPLKDTPQNKTCKWPKGRSSRNTGASSHPSYISHFQNWWVTDVASLWRKNAHRLLARMWVWTAIVEMKDLFTGILWSNNLTTEHRVREIKLLLPDISASRVYIALFTKVKLCHQPLAHQHKMWDVQTDTYKTYVHIYFCILTCMHISLYM